MGLEFKDGDVPDGEAGDERFPQSLQAKLEEYNRNFDALDNFLGEGEVLAEGFASELRIEKTKEMLSQALPIGVKTLIQVATFGKTDGVRLKAAIYLIDRCLGKDATVGEDDAATALLRRLQATPVVSDPDSDDFMRRNSMEGGE